MKKKMVMLMLSVMVTGSMAACGSATDAGTDSTVTNTESASVAETTETVVGDAAESEYLYGTLNVAYADYYYGELEGIEPEANPESLTGQYDAADVVTESGYREEGVYDAVTSATNAKSTKFEGSFYEEEGEGVNILGASNVNVAISKSLYEDVQTAIANGTECQNKLVEMVESLENVTEEVPAEYKVLNSDGVLSKTVGNTILASDAVADITTTSTWGNYQITIEGIEVEAAAMQGAVLETEDGKKYGLQHEDNLWLQPAELAFSVTEFVDPHDNVAGYARFADIEGKTITKITYLLANADDLEIETSLYVKNQAPAEYAVSGDEMVTFNSAGTNISVSLDTADSVYELSAVKYGRSYIEEGLFEMKDGSVTLAASCMPGEYNLIFSNDTYSNIILEVMVESGLSASDFTTDNNTIVISEESGIAAADYISSISTILLNGEPINGRNLGSTIFMEDGTVNLDAAISSDNGETKIFDGQDAYVLTMQATGFPDIEMTVSVE